MEDQNSTGLGDTPKAEWAKPDEEAIATIKPIDRLLGDDALHQKVRDHLMARLDLSERQMNAFYDRWNVMERKLQGYIKLKDWEQLVKEQENNKGKAPKVLSVTIPYSFAIVSTIATYLLHTFTGRRPMFQVGSYKKETMAAARNMETILQYNADHTRLVKKLHRYMMDGLSYGVGVLKCSWTVTKGKRTKWNKAPAASISGQLVGESFTPSREERVVYAGNEVESVDPFMFFPDPRVPMHEVNRKGEFVFFREFVGKHILKKGEAQEIYKGVDKARATLPESKYSGTGQYSLRNLRAEGEDRASTTSDGIKMASYYQVDEGTCEIIPAELGLGTSEVPEKWLFTIINKDRIIRAEPFEADHDMHPCAVIEPYALGGGFGNLGVAEYVDPMQDIITWLVNSHIANVRTVINNKLIVDPARVEMGDLRESAEGGWIVRLKSSAFGQDVNTVAKQFEVRDVTSGHMKDAEAFGGFGHMITGANENLMGQQAQGGRKTATEVRTSGEAGASRLAALARVISAQGIVDLTEMMTTNNLQYLDREFEITVLGSDGLQAPLRISPDMLTGDFHFPVHDGTLPLDRVALLDIWKELFLAISKDPQLRAEYSVPRIFDWIAELGGARNIETMKLQPNEMTQPPMPGQPPAVPGQPQPALPAPPGVPMEQALEGFQ